MAGTVPGAGRPLQLKDGAPDASAVMDGADLRPRRGACRCCWLKRAAKCRRTRDRAARRIGGPQAAVDIASDSAVHARELAEIMGREGEPWHTGGAGGMLSSVVYGFNDGLTANSVWSPGSSAQTSRRTSSSSAVSRARWPMRSRWDRADTSRRRAAGGSRPPDRDGTR